MMKVCKNCNRFNLEKREKDMCLYKTGKKLELWQACHVLQNEGDNRDVTARYRNDGGIVCEGLFKSIEELLHWIAQQGAPDNTPSYEYYAVEREPEKTYTFAHMWEMAKYGFEFTRKWKCPSGVIYYLDESERLRYEVDGERKAHFTCSLAAEFIDFNKWQLVKKPDPPKGTEWSNLPSEQKKWWNEIPKGGTR